MESIIRVLFIILLSSILLAGPIDGRKNPGEYWIEMMKGQPIPEAIKDFINQNSYEVLEKGEATKGFIKDFVPIPNISVYHNDVNPKEVKSHKADCNLDHDKLAFEKLAVDEFEPIPNISVYND